jgi:uracil-DNA glycosylase
MECDALIQMEEGWKACLCDEFSKPYMGTLQEFLCQEIASGKTIYPKKTEYFSAFNSTPFDKVAVVILGQDPYHGPNQAHGLCFSVPKGVGAPPSLKNIFKEIQADLGFNSSDFPHGNLQSWADQGVLLLNSVLTVEQGHAASHHKKGWTTFTDKAIAELNARKEGIVFMLWGAYAQKKGEAIDGKKHLVLNAPHPSPLSAHNGFLGCRHFSQANSYLDQQGKLPINWRLS